LTSDDAFVGRRVLLVEDEALISMNVVDMLSLLGCVVVGPAARVGEAIKVVEADSGGIDAAVLDVNLDGEPSFAVADALVERNIPFVFATGYGVRGLRDDLRDRPVLQKPFRMRDLRRVLGAVLEPG